MAKTRVIQGERIGASATLRMGCAVVIFDENRRLLLTRRQDNGQWCLPSGGMDPGESASEAAERETLEETGLVVRVTRLIGVYSSPHMITEYPDGNRVQVVSLTFLAEVVGGELSLSDETTDVGFFTQEDLGALDVIENHEQRIKDSFVFEDVPFIR